MGARRRVKKHWIVSELFQVARDRGLQKKAWEPLHNLILESTGVNVPQGTLRHWNEGYSTPRIDEVDLIASALDHELDLMVGVTPIPVQKMR